MRIFDLSQPLNERSSFWPYYPPFEVKYIKRKSEHGVNAQYIQTSNHMGTHLDAPRHFVTAGKTIDELPLAWLCGPGVIVDLRDEMDELGVYTPQMIEKRAEVQKGDLLYLHTGWHRYADFGATPEEEQYYHYQPGAQPDMVPWLLEKQIHVWGVDCVSTDHPMNLPIGRFLGKGQHGHCDKVRAKAEQKFGGKAGVDKMFPDSAYQLTHNALFPKDCVHIENLGGELERRLTKGETPGLLCGLPVGIKDVTPVKGLRTTFGSPLYRDFVPAEDALVVQRLRAAGAVILGKTNTPEFAAGGNTFNEVFGRTRNPWNPAKSAGGSTGGGAAALATGMIGLAEGTDLGGSLRIPASFCGVVGLRPSPGLVPTWPPDWAGDTLQSTGP